MMLGGAAEQYTSDGPGRAPATSHFALDTVQCELDYSNTTKCTSQVVDASQLDDSVV